MIRELKENDISGLNSLTPASWKYDYETFLRDFIQEDFFYAFVLIQDNQIVGTGNVLVKGKIGWLANIIVNSTYRGKGLGLHMTRFLVAFSKEKKCETHLLIATALGEAIYRKIGFRKMTEYVCFDSQVAISYSRPMAVRALNLSDLESIYALDREANGEDRSHLIDKYYTNGLGYFNDEGELLGCYLPLFGRGLVLSRDTTAGIELLKLKHSKKGARTLVPLENQESISVLESNGLKKGDTSARMVLGIETKWKPTYIYSYGSGYCG